MGGQQEETRTEFGGKVQRSVDSVCWEQNPDTAASSFIFRLDKPKLTNTAHEEKGKS